MSEQEKTSMEKRKVSKSEQELYIRYCLGMISATLAEVTKTIEATESPVGEIWKQFCNKESVETLLSKSKTLEWQSDYLTGWCEKLNLWMDDPDEAMFRQEIINQE